MNADGEAAIAVLIATDAALRARSPRRLDRSLRDIFNRNKKRTKLEIIEERARAHRLSQDSESEIDSAWGGSERISQELSRRQGTGLSEAGSRRRGHLAGTPSVLGPRATRGEGRAREASARDLVLSGHGQDGDSVTAALGQGGKGRAHRSGSTNEVRADDLAPGMAVAEMTHLVSLCLPAVGHRAAGPRSQDGIVEAGSATVRGSSKMGGNSGKTLELGPAHADGVGEAVVVLSDGDVWGMPGSPHTPQSAQGRGPGLLGVTNPMVGDGWVNPRTASATTASPLSRGPGVDAARAKARPGSTPSLRRTLLNKDLPSDTANATLRAVDEESPSESQNTSNASGASRRPDGTPGTGEGGSGRVKPGLRAHACGSGTGRGTGHAGRPNVGSDPRHLCRPSQGLCHRLLSSLERPAPLADAVDSGRGGPGVRGGGGGVEDGAAQPRDLGGPRHLHAQLVGCVQDELPRRHGVGPRAGHAGAERVDAAGPRDAWRSWDPPGVGRQRHHRARRRPGVGGPVAGSDGVHAPGRERVQHARRERHEHPCRGTRHPGAGVPADAVRRQHRRSRSRVRLRAL